MVRQRNHRLWLAIVVVAAGIGIGLGVGVGGGLVAGGSLARGVPPGARDAATVSFTTAAVEAAVVPVRTEAGPTAGAARHGQGRWLLPLVAALAGLGGLFGTRTGLVRATLPGRQALRARRHAIALRAPPSLQLA